MMMRGVMETVVLTFRTSYDGTLVALVAVVDVHS